MSLLGGFSPPCPPPTLPGPFPFACFVVTGWVPVFYQAQKQKAIFRWASRRAHFSQVIFPSYSPPRSSFSFYPPSPTIEKNLQRISLVLDILGPFFDSIHCRSFVEDHLSLLFLRLCVVVLPKNSLILFSASVPILSRNPCYSTCTDDAFLGYPPSILSYSPKRFSNPPPFLLFPSFLFNLSITILCTRIVFIHLRSVYLFKFAQFFFFHSSLF